MPNRNNAATRSVLITGTAVCVLVGAAVFLIMQRRTVPTPAQLYVCLKCANCGEVLKTNAEFVTRNAKRFYPDPLSPGLTCPKCEKTAMVMAYECPKDHTTFYGIHLPKDPDAAPPRDPEAPRAGTDNSPIVCPACGWDPVAEQRAQMQKH